MRRRAFDPLIGAAVVTVLLLGACRQPARPRPQRSIVLVTIDTLRADHVSPRLMPALDALGHQAVFFEQAITVAPLTLPAHASLLTGLYPPRHRVRDNQMFALPGDVPTYASLLKRHGYATGAFVSAVVLSHRYGLNRGFDVYDDDIAGPERPAADTIARAQRWIDDAARPFFLWLHLFEPHAPYQSGSYAGEVTAVDTTLGAFISHLRTTSSWNDLIVSVTADHGESLGEHGEQTHGFFLYDATLRIPWILKAPGIAPRRVKELVRIVDEMPTILDAAGIAERGGSGAVDGVSVTPLIRDGRLGLEAYSETYLPRDQFAWSALSAIRTERFKYIEAPRPELYALDRDPGEIDNLVSARAADADRLKRLLAAISKPPSAPTANPSTDPELMEQLMSLGYIAHTSAPQSQTDAGLADPKSKIEVYNLAMTALERSERGDASGALEALARAEQLDPEVEQIQFLKGTLLGRIGRFDLAATALERALTLDPQDTSARFKLALAWLRMGDADRATVPLQEVVRHEPDNFRAWHNLAAIAYSRGDLDAAERLERKALAISPTYAEGWNTLGAIALVRKDTGAAIAALTKATEFGPANAQAFDNLSLALRTAGQTARARAASQRACALDTRFCTTGERP